MQAIIETGGKQISLDKNSIIYIEKVDLKEGEKITFDKVLYNGKEFGNPFIKGCKVTGIVEKQGKMPKIHILRYQPKSNVRVKHGHRQPYTRVKITDICAE